jgi:hypothetical protein
MRTALLSTGYFLRNTCLDGPAAHKTAVAKIDKRMETWYKPRNSSMAGWIPA